MSAIYPIDAVNWRSLAFLSAVVAVLAYFLRGAFATRSTAIAASIAAIAMGLLFVQLFVVRIRITGPDLVVGGGLYTLKVPLRDVYPERAIVAGQGHVPSLVFRTNGVGMPGLALGWFRTRERSKVFGAVADAEKAVLLPTAYDYDIVVSPRDPDKFLRDLRTYKSSLQ
jgi:hypothetical protein